MNTDRLQSLVSQILYLAPSFPSSSSSNHDLQLLAPNQLTTEEFQAAEGAMLPIMLAQAASRNDDSLAVLLSNLSAAIPSTGDQFDDTAVGNYLNSTKLAPRSSPLHLAASLGILRNVTLLLQQGASVHKRNENGHTPLYCAAVCIQTQTLAITDVLHPATSTPLSRTSLAGGWCSSIYKRSRIG